MDVVLKDSSFQQANASSSVRSSDEGETVIGIYLLLLGWFSWLGNGAVICILCRRRTSLDSQDLLMFNLAVSDAGISIFGYSRGIVELFHGLRKDVFWTCNVDGFLILLFGLISINTLTAISLLRYLKGCRPHQAHRVNKDYISMVILIIWISAIIWSGSPVLGWGSFIESKYGTCEIDWSLATSSPPYKVYVIGVFLSGFFIPVIVMIFCYVSIIRAVHQSHKCSRGADISRRQIVMERDITRVSFVICTAFVLAWSPYAVLSMWSACGFQVPLLTTLVATLFAKSASFYNPIIYLGLSPKFRHELRALLYCTQEKKDLPIDSEEPEKHYEVNMRPPNDCSHSSNGTENTMMTSSSSSHQLDITVISK
ncbi:visual pigment-like receptor peropsin [Anomaloglossus baeobatrachus]|uniref:visual pigment-like receptor peropsin n=1 Tax=Anomaloglossus baeobatrachus TaxID=238106 RepID=UPI003F502D31